MKVPWGMPYIGKEELDEIVDSVKSGWVTMGPKAAQFEKNISEYIGVKHAIAVNSGTAALDIALKVMEIGPGDEVIIPAMTYIATANAVLFQGAKPVLADIEPRTYNLDPGDIGRRVTKKTKCIMPIDYGGQCADYDALEQICQDYRIPLVVDGAQSLGAEYKGRKACSFGEISITSFHAAKLITSVEGGMVFTNNDELARKARIIRNQGEEQRYHHVLLGHNYRMSDLHAAVGLAQFRRIEKVIKKRQELTQRYTNSLREYSHLVTLPYVPPCNKHAWFRYTMVLDNRDQVEKYLHEKGIDTRVCWPMPIHQQPLYQPLFNDAHHPVAEKFAKGSLDLPLYFSMTEAEQDYVIKHVTEAIEKFAKRRHELT
ncbi:DegT/DnrJ/EryC1/StrS family aminotransferase [Chloroflexota bacterium]